MATGENGASGPHVRRRVNRENNQEHVNVIPHLPNMEERNVMARHRKVKFVTTTYLAQVSFKCRQTGGFPRKLVLVFQNESSLKISPVKISLVCTKMNLWTQPIFISRNGFAPRLVLTKRQKASREKPIQFFFTIRVSVIFDSFL